MGKVFVKSPVESPNDLLAKQTAAVAPSMSQKIRRRGADFGRTVRDELKELAARYGPAAANFAATRDVVGGGKELARSVGKFANNEIQNFGQFAAAGINPIIALLGRAPQTPEEQEYARQLLREQIAQQRQEELAPEKEAAALRQFGIMGMDARDIKNRYPYMSTEEALRQEMMARGTVARGERVATLRDEPATTQAQEKEEKKTIVDTSDAFDRDPSELPKSLRDFRDRTNEASILDRVMGNTDIADEEFLESLDNYEPPTLGGVPGFPVARYTRPPPPTNNISELKENMGEIPELTSDQGVVGQERLHAEMEKNNQNMDSLPPQGAGVQRQSAMPAPPAAPREDEEEGPQPLAMPPSDATGPFAFSGNDALRRLGNEQGEK